MLCFTGAVARVTFQCYFPSLSLMSPFVFIVPLPSIWSLFNLNWFPRRMPKQTLSPGLQPGPCGKTTPTTLLTRKRHLPLKTPKTAYFIPLHRQPTQNITGYLLQLFTSLWWEVRAPVIGFNAKHVLQETAELYIWRKQEGGRLD